MQPQARNSPYRILFGLPEGNFYAAEFVRLAFPGAEHRFIGYSWSTGRLVRAAGFPYRSVPMRAGAKPIAHIPPPIAEYRTRAFVPGGVPTLALAALAALAELVQDEIDRAPPDLVVFGPIEHAVCHLLHKVCLARGIPAYGFQPCYVSGAFILNTHGPAWEAALRSAVPVSSPPSAAALGLRKAGQAPRAQWTLFLRGMESALRLLIGDNSFDTIGTLTANTVVRMVRPRWFPWAQRLRLENLPQEFVLVTLHQPCLAWEDNDWRALIEYCLAAVPGSYALVIRPHPTEAPQEVSAPLREQLLARGALVSDTDTAPDLCDLIGGCKAVFTLTSATGFQALLRGRMVFTLASAFYCRAGLARHVPRDAVNAFTDWLAEGAPGPDRATVIAFDTWLRGARIWPYPTNGLAATNLVARRLIGALHA